MRCIDYIDEAAQSTRNKNKWKDWNLVVRRCHRDGWGKNTSPQGGRGSPMPDYEGQEIGVYEHSFFRYGSG